MAGKNNTEISWAQFERCNQDARSAFEALCRKLFKEYFFDGKSIFHSNPNNPGVEIDPIFHKDSGKRISFQAKYFSAIDYEQIKHSARMTIKYYGDNLDLVYLYCNKPVATNSDSFKQVVKILAEKDIEIITISDQEILDQVSMSEKLSLNYFNSLLLKDEWFQEKLVASFNALGPRYDCEFNVTTSTESQFNYFLCNDAAAQAINQNKQKLIDTLNGSYYYKQHVGYSIISAIINALYEIEDITEKTINDCQLWGDRVKEKCKNEFVTLTELLHENQKNLTIAEESGDDKKIRDIFDKINAIKSILDIPKKVMPIYNYQALLKNQVAIINGIAGSGKSQMLATSAKKLHEEGYATLLVLGQNFINEAQINSQFMEVIDVDLSLEQLLNKLDFLGEEKNHYSYILVDAINESIYTNVWKAGLRNLITLVSRFPHIKLAISVRSKYEKLVFDESIFSLIKDKTISEINHTGFRDNSIEATEKFLNHYGISFLPSYSLQLEMENPLFLKLFCKNYAGEYYDIFSLFEIFMRRADEEAQKASGFTESIYILDELIYELAEKRLDNDSFFISRPVLFTLKFWQNYGLENSKIPYVQSLLKSELLVTSIIDENEVYSLGYNLLGDFVLAKAILRRFKDKDTLYEYIKETLLRIEEGCIENWSNIDVFVILCALFAENYHEELIETIGLLITDEYEKRELVEQYIESFSWRKASTVNVECFEKIIKKNKIPHYIYFKVLIKNSAKEKHPLNAIYLHRKLFDLNITTRDENWTSYINTLSREDERVFQLIQFFECGNTFSGSSEENVELVLILFTWFLTSSNRMLRDRASKSMVELLKENFKLSIPLLERFNEVNDPYVIQRLYGNVFGASVSNNSIDKETFTKLARLVYCTVFDKEIVPSDALLRDYARLIIERYKYIFPDSSSDFDIRKITPPYHSEAIPKVEKQEYTLTDNSGLVSIDVSMRVDVPGGGGYGDFGRYIFQSSLKYFEGVDLLNLYHYAMQEIIHRIGYTKALGYYDRNSRVSMDRSTTKKLERIGKKYQWIAFHNILGRVSDSYPLKLIGEETSKYKGPWDVYARDFDPTLNFFLLDKQTSPDIIFPHPSMSFCNTTPISEETIDAWAREETDFFSKIYEKLFVKDKSGKKWVGLYLREEQNNKLMRFEGAIDGFPKGSQSVWLQAGAYFCRRDHFELLKKDIESSKFNREDFVKHESSYQLFSREYPWSLCAKSILINSWREYDVESETYRLEKQTRIVPRLDFDTDSVEHVGFSINFEEKEEIVKVPERIDKVQVLPAFLTLYWDEQYDASQSENRGIDVPCADLVDYFGLDQGSCNGFFYDTNHELIAFDGALTGRYEGILFSEEHLRKYLNQNDLIMFWDFRGEKQFFLGGYSQMWNNWSGCLWFDGKEFHGKVSPEEKTNKSS